MIPAIVLKITETTSLNREQTMTRVPIPEDVAAKVLYLHDHTCCICQERGRHVQIHHIDEDPANNDAANLAVLCTECHNDTMIRGGFGKKLHAAEVRLYRDEWIQRVQMRKGEADRLTIQSILGRKEVAETRDWEPPSDIALYTYLQSIPDIMANAYALSQKNWEKGGGVATQATYQVIDVVEQIWIQLSAWYPPNHFGKPAPEYFNEFVGSRFEFRRALMEPEGPGTAGTMIRPMVAYGVFLQKHLSRKGYPPL
jgi:hypothetical protein